MSSRPGGRQARAGARAGSGCPSGPRATGFCGVTSTTRRLVAVLGLAAHVADRLVEQHRDLLRLLDLRAFASIVMRWLGQHARAELG